jgi:hypothetical protein
MGKLIFYFKGYGSTKFENLLGDAIISTEVVNLQKSAGQFEDGQMAVTIVVTVSCSVVVLLHATSMSQSALSECCLIQRLFNIAISFI